jgi:hypothetical protein
MTYTTSFTNCPELTLDELDAASGGLGHVNLVEVLKQAAAGAGIGGLIGGGIGGLGGAAVGSSLGAIAGAAYETISELLK